MIRDIAVFIGLVLLWAWGSFALLAVVLGSFYIAALVAISFL